MLAAIAVLFPQLFHLTGFPSAGQMLLPMHIPVLLCGLWLGPYYGGAVGAVAPLLSCLLTQMPVLARMPFMSAELFTYGVVCGLLFNTLRLSRYRFGVYPALIGAMLAGRVVYALSLAFAGGLLGVAGASPLAAVSATVTGVPGIVIQLIFVPILLASLRRIGGITEE